MLDVLPLSARRRRSEQVKKGRRHAAAIFPQGFGEKSVAALFSGRDKPKHRTAGGSEPEPSAGGWWKACLRSTPMKDISARSLHWPA